MWKYALVAASVLLSAQVSAGEAEIRARLDKAYPGLPINSVQSAPMPGLFEVSLGTGDVLYTTENGEYFVVGNLYQVTEQGFNNLTEARQNQERQALLKELDANEAVVYPAKGEVKARLHVFTDVDCGYCRKLHKEIPELNAAGVEVRYLAFPRTGINSPTYHTMVSVWCAKDQQQAMDLAKAGKQPEKLSCDNPVAKHYMLGKQMGVTGTPALVFENGELVPGYMPAANLLQALGL
ncbi:DsbC family protein [Balneatrix alpica]|uniref:DsbC family protein n=1 Tax=Balneatrix alpica TaxID=75684 RepID=UPI002739673B|nr:DsbC family protein [Balneatrix alpica]